MGRHHIAMPDRPEPIWWRPPRQPDRPVRWWLSLLLAPPVGLMRHVGPVLLAALHYAVSTAVVTVVVVVVTLVVVNVVLFAD